MMCDIAKYGNCSDEATTQIEAMDEDGKVMLTKYYCERHAHNDSPAKIKILETSLKMASLGAIKSFRRGPIEEDK